MKTPNREKQEFPEKAARAAAVATASGALVCGVCCVLPVAIPALALAGGGSTIAWLGRAQSWATTARAIAHVLYFHYQRAS
jgi:hypothetical protein